MIFIIQCLSFLVWFINFFSLYVNVQFGAGLYGMLCFDFFSLWIWLNIEEGLIGDVVILYIGDFLQQL